MQKRTEEWLKQAEYDFDTARYMQAGGRNLYAIFMAHLAVEKALKGLYHEKLCAVPPKVHSLTYLINAVGLAPPTDLGKFIIKLSEASIPTRYPDDLAKVQQLYTEAAVSELLASSEQVMVWIKQQL